MTRRALFSTVLLALSLARAAALAEDSLEALNSVARANYSEARAALLAQQGPVILVNGDDAVLFRGKERTAATYMPAIYHKLKTVSHAPLAIFVQLNSYGEVRLTESQLAQLRRLRTAIAVARDNLERQGFSPEQLPRQKKQLEDCLDFLDPILKEGRSSTEALVAFCRAQKPLILANVTEGARAQLDGLHGQVSTWRKELSAADWARLRVVVIGSQMPRQENLAVQYFAKLLGEKGEGPRIIYAEALFEEERAMRLLGTHLLDRALAIAFFDDPLRMNRDLLGKAAAEYLKTMKME